MTNTSPQREIKAQTTPSADPATEPQIVASMMEALAAYRDANDERLEALEKRGSADPLLADKLARIDAALDANTDRLNRLSATAQRPRLETASARLESSDHARAF